MIQIARQLLAACVLYAISQPVTAQDVDTLWTKTFGGALSDGVYTVEETSDGGYIMVGETYSFADGAADAWLIRTDAQGDTLWTRTYGGEVSRFESARSAHQTSDGGFVLAGTVSGAVADVLLIRTDAGGDTLWTRTFGEFDTDMGYDLVEAPDGGFVVCGSTRSQHIGFGSSVWLIRTDVDGDILWTKTYGGSSYQGGYAIDATADDGFIVTGSYNNGGPRSADVWLLRTDAAGDTLWTKTFGGDGTEEGFAVVQTVDGGFAVAAGAYRGGPEITLIRTDADGDSLWTQTFVGSVSGHGALDHTNDGGFMLAATSMEGDALLIRTDEHGGMLWSKTFEGSGSDEGTAVRQTADGGFIFAGVTESHGAGQSDAWLIRLGASTGTSTEDVPSETPQTFRLDQNFPNPFNPTTAITYSVLRPGNVHLSVYNVLGEEVVTLVNGAAQAGDYSVTWSGRNHAGQFSPTGLYFYRMSVGDAVQTRSMVLTK